MITMIIEELLNQYKDILNQKLIKELITYYKERYPHDYFYTPKNSTIDTLKSIKNRL